jgi:group II intron reverse transcriptase/maturase
MQNAEQILSAIRKLGEKRLPLTRVYRCLFNEEVFLAAYGKLSRNQGAMTPGTTNDTVDGMSRARIRAIIEQLRFERFHPRPARRIHITKKSGGQRPLGLPNFSEKLVQEVLRMILEAYYEPRFRDSSHGFRPTHGCHTALQAIKHRFDGTVWFIEGDIRGAFDNIDHTVLMNILARDIHDGRLLNLIQLHLQAGVMEDWQYHATYSGTPQGAVLSPLLSNIYLHALDEFVEDRLIPLYTRGKARAKNLDYKRFEHRINQAQQRGDTASVLALKRERRQYPAGDMYDSNFRRLRYIRYADDFILSFIGPKAEAEEIKEQLRAFLHNELRLELHPEKTLITHAHTEHARFLGYAVSIYHTDDKLARRCDNRALTRSINGKVRLGVPHGLIDQHAKRYARNGTVVSEASLLQSSVPNIIQTFQARYRGLVEYYKYAVDRKQFGKLKYAMEIALVKTLAHKLRISVSQVYRSYRTTKTVDERVYRVLQTEVETAKGPRQFTWGGIPLTVVKIGHAQRDDDTPISDRRHDFEVPQYFELRSEIVTRMRADRCEVCEAEGDCEVHHIRKLADLRQRGTGRKEKPLWMRKMIALRRKTLVVCHACHQAIHNGQPLSGRNR